MENGPALELEERMKTLGFWAKGSVIADGAKEGAGEATSASYLVDIMPFV